MTISAVIIAKNAAEKIQRALNSLTFVDETIIVIDSATADNTAEVAKKAGAKVFTKAWEGYGKQKNYGAQQATGNWLLFIDDDEEVTPELKNEIQNIIQKPTHDVYWIRIVTTFMGKALTHVYGHNPRLIKKNTAIWTNDFVHEQIALTNGVRVQLGDNQSGLITTPLLHHSHPTIASYLTKMHRYTTLDAKEMAKTQKHRSGRSVKPSFFLPTYLGLRQFVKLYLYRRGIFDGWAGFMWCLLSAYYEWEMAQKFNTLKK